MCDDQRQIICVQYYYKCKSKHVFSFCHLVPHNEANESFVKAVMLKIAEMRREYESVHSALFIFLCGRNNIPGHV